MGLYAPHWEAGLETERNEKKKNGKERTKEKRGDRKRTLLRQVVYESGGRRRDKPGVGRSASGSVGPSRVSGTWMGRQRCVCGGVEGGGDVEEAQRAGWRSQASLVGGVAPRPRPLPGRW